MKQPFRFSDIIKKKPQDWAAGIWKMNDPPGTLYLLDELGLSGGILKISNGYFVTLDKDEVNGDADVVWPESFERFRIVKDKFELA